MISLGEGVAVAAEGLDGEGAQEGRRGRGGAREEPREGGAADAALLCGRPAFG